MRTRSCTPFLALVFICGLLAGFGIYAALSYDPGKIALYTADAPEPIGLYSQAVRCGDYIFTSGQIGLDPATGTVAGETVQVMENLQALLAEGGLDLTDLADFEGVNAVYAGYFEEP